MMGKIGKIGFYLVLAHLGLEASAQVGIGNPNPNTGSVLDLSNATDKAFVLPTPSVSPDLAPNFTTQGMVFYYSDKLYLKTSTGMNVLSPWQYSGTSTDGTYIPSGTTVGIGLTPIVLSPVLLHIAAGTDATTASSAGSFAIGVLTTNHMLADEDELLVKTNGTTAGIMKLQDDGGTVQVRNGATATSNTVVTANGSIDAAGSGKILQNGLDLVPTGTILMWYGSIDASGYPLMGATPNTNWHVCDGTAGTPDLRERFIVGSGGDNATVPGGGYTSTNTGGENTHALSVGEMASHNHTGSTSSDGSHSHTFNPIPNGGEGYALSYNGNNEAFDWDETITATTSSDGAHTHTLTTNNTGSGTAHENRPPFFAVYYIIKL